MSQYLNIFCLECYISFFLSNKDSLLTPSILILSIGNLDKLQSTLHSCPAILSFVAVRLCFYRLLTETVTSVLRM